MPKAVRCTQGRLASIAIRSAESFGYDRNDVAYCAMPLFHGNALMALWGPTLSVGGTVALARRFSASQFLPLMAVPWFIYDRYFFPVMAPLIPVIAAVATRAQYQRAARAWATAAIAAGLVLYAIGEQDYLAWQAARDRAAHLAYGMASPEQVQAGFEANAVYVELPRYERTGHADLFAILGPANPQITLLFAPTPDPRKGMSSREGVSYSSLAPGRIELARTTER